MNVTQLRRALARKEVLVRVAGTQTRVRITWASAEKLHRECAGQIEPAPEAKPLRPEVLLVLELRAVREAIDNLRLSIPQGSDQAGDGRVELRPIHRKMDVVVKHDDVSVAKKATIGAIVGALDDEGFDWSTLEEASPEEVEAAKARGEFYDLDARRN